MSGESKNNKPTKYSDKLKDPRWQKVRLKVFERDEWTCQVCFDTESQLKVHHKYYLQGKDPWDYPLEAFSTLCEKCHTEEWENRPEAEHALMWALKEKGFFAADVQALSDGMRKMELLHSHEVVATAYEWAFETPEIQRWLLDKYFEAIRQKQGNRKMMGTMKIVSSEQVLCPCGRKLFDKNSFDDGHVEINPNSEVRFESGFSVCPCGARNEIPTHVSGEQLRIQLEKNPKP